MIDWAPAAMAAVLMGMLAHGWKAQPGVMWAIITLMLYFIVWSASHLALALGIGLQVRLDEMSIAVGSALFSVGLLTFALWSLRRTRSR